MIPYEPWHVDEMDVQNAQESAPEVIVDGHTFTIVDGTILACFGACEVWQGRYVAWAVLSKGAAKKMLTVTRTINSYLKKATGRIEITVDCNFSEGHRWAKMLGFNCEAERMINFGKDGTDYSLYARINHG